jgi:hypothetical protein
MSLAPVGPEQCLSGGGKLREQSQNNARVTAAISFKANELPHVSIESTPFDPDEYIRLALHFYDHLIRTQQTETARRFGTVGDAVFTKYENLTLVASTDARVLVSDRVWLHLFDRGNGERALLLGGAAELPEEVLEKALFSFVSLIASRFDSNDRLFLRDALLSMEEGYDWDETLRGNGAHDVPNHAFFSMMLERREEASGE